MERSLHFFCESKELFFVHDARFSDFAHDGASVANSFDNVPCPRLPFGTYKGCALRYTPECFAKVARAAHKRNLEIMLIDVVFFISGSKNF